VFQKNVVVLAVAMGFFVLSLTLQVGKAYDPAGRFGSRLTLAIYPLPHSVSRHVHLRRWS
jgi:hypothetical protein